MSRYRLTIVRIEDNPKWDAYQANPQSFGIHVGISPTIETPVLQMDVEQEHYDAMRCGALGLGK